MFTVVSFLLSVFHGLSSCRESITVIDIKGFSYFAGYLMVAKITH